MKCIAPTLTIALTLGTALTSAAQAAQPVDLSTWQTNGDVAVRSGIVDGLALGGQSVYVLGTASAIYQDDTEAAGTFNLSGQEPAAAGQPGGVEDTLLMPLGAFGADGDEGSAMARTQTLSAGDTISFQWRVATRTSADLLASEPDSVWFSTSTPLTTGLGANTLALQLGRLDTLGLTATGTGWLDSGWRSFSWTATQAGTYTVGFAVVDQGSFTDTSWLAVSALTVTPAAPEPGTWALAALGLGLAASVRQRRQR